MKKKLVVAVATTLILASGSSIASASAGSGDSSSTSTTAPAGLRSTDAQRAAQRAQNDARNKYLIELAKYLESRRAIDTTFKTAMVEAQRTFKIARQSARTPLAMRSATQVFTSAVRTAAANKNAALQELGAPPVKP